MPIIGDLWQDFSKSISYRAKRLGDPDSSLENYFWSTDICPILYIASGVCVTISRAKLIVLPQISAMQIQAQSVPSTLSEHNSAFAFYNPL